MWQSITKNFIINVGFVAWFSAQVIKTMLTLISTREFNLERLVGAGGMPSSHTALCVSVAVATARKVGFDSVEFALALTLTVVVMYDAMGVRRAAGEQAKLLNRLVANTTHLPWFEKKTKEHYVEAPLEDIKPKEAQESPEGELVEGSSLFSDIKLKELLGHTPIEVLGGAILGIIVAVLMPLS